MHVISKRSSLSTLFLKLSKKRNPNIYKYATVIMLYSV